MIRLALFVLAASAVAQPSSKPILQDVLAQHLKISGWSSWKIDHLPNGQFRIFAKSSPDSKVTADWILDGNKLVASSLTMYATDKYKLVSAEMSGGITFTQANKGQSLVVVAAKATYTASDNKIIVPGAMSLTSSDEDTNMKASGHDGIVVLADGGADPLSSAVIEGPIDFSLKGHREESGKKLPYNVDGKAGKLRYTQSDRSIRLTEGVQLSGNDPALVGDITGVSEATIFLNASREVESIEMSGDPGKTVIEQKTKKTGGGKTRTH